MPTIPERARLIKRAVCDAYGITEDFMAVGNNNVPAGEARRVAASLLDENMGFMGIRWVLDQLGYNTASSAKSVGGNAPDPKMHQKARDIYEALLRDAQ